MTENIQKKFILQEFLKGRKEFELDEIKQMPKEVRMTIVQMIWRATGNIA